MTQRVLNGGAAATLSPPAPALGTLLCLLALPVVTGLAGCRAVDHVLFVLSRPPSAQEIRIDFPPIQLSGNGSSARSVQLAPMWITAPIDGWMHGFTVVISDAAGNPVPSTILHHLKVLRPEEREIFHPIMLRVLAAGGETKGARIPRSIGIPVSKGDSLLATAMVHDEIGIDLEEVRVGVRIEVTPAEGPPFATPAYPFFLQVPGPQDEREFDLPPGRTEASLDARPAVAGEILGFGGHAHRFAVELRFEEVTGGRVLWRSRIRKDAAGHVLAVPRKVYTIRRGPIIDPEHLYRVTVVYENPTGDTLRAAGMGTIAGLIVPHEPWPEVDRTDPLYLRDRRRETDPAAGTPREHVH